VFVVALLIQHQVHAVLEAGARDPASVPVARVEAEQSGKTRVLAREYLPYLVIAPQRLARIIV